MKRKGFVGLLAFGLAVLAILGSAAEFGGSIGASVEILPSLAAGSVLGITASGNGWSFSSDTTLTLTPSFGAQESVSLTYALGFATLAVQASMDLVPWAFGSAALLATLDLFSVDLRDDDPVASLDGKFSTGVKMSGDLDPFAYFTARLLLEHESHTLENTTTLSLLPLGVKSTLLARLSLGEHALTSTTTFSLLPLGVTSTLLAQLSLGSVALGEEDGAMVVSASAEALQSLIPFAFGHAKLSATATAGAFSLASSLTYSGGAAFLAQLTATVEVDRLTVQAWGSYETSGDSPFGAGVSASIALGHMED